MNDITMFSNAEFGNVRVVNVSGEPWFVAKDIAEALGYVDTAAAIRSHVDADDKGVGEITIPGGVQNITIINESGSLLNGRRREDCSFTIC